MRLTYPHTETVEQVDDYHGTPIADPYRWLEDAGGPRTRAWVAEQNRLTASWLAEEPARDGLRRRLAELWDHPRRDAPWRRGERWFQLRNSGLQNQDVLWTMPGPAEQGAVLLDPNQLSADGTVALAALAVSPDGQLLAYATSTAGSDWMTWRVREVASGRDLDDRLEWSKFSGAAWTADAAGFYYARYDAPAEGRALDQANRNQRLHYHRVGTRQGDDPLVYARPDEPDWGFDPHVTEDGRYLVVQVWQGTDPRNRVLVADLEPGGELRGLLTDFDAGYGLLGSDGSTLYFLTDLDAPRGRIVAVDAGGGKRREVVPEAADTLEWGQRVGDRLVAIYLVDASHRVRLFRLDGSPAGELRLPGLGAVGGLTGRASDVSLHLTFTSFTAPAAVYRHDLQLDQTVLVSPPGLAATAVAYVTEQVFVASRDGTRVPMFVVRRADLAPSGDVPTLLYGYGGFKISLTPTFKVPWLVWLERGGILAVANLRGGGEYGSSWHDAGRLAAKQNVFDDFAACAEALVAAGWTRPYRLAIQGASNGGLLVGASLTQRPELFGAAVIEVGVLDLLRFHHFTIGWGWTSDYGDPGKPEDCKTLLGYSPLHNLTPGAAYPATLVTTGDHDDRVVPAHSYKFVAALQAAQGGDRPVLIRVETDTGHGAGKPTSKAIDERADVLAFLVRALAWDTAEGG